ncbi:MAG TPA: ATP-binding protein [Candidatus Brocadiia bacterium]|nr:ATP-binding protein [Candidatus Brocadiales bacterium]
MPSNNIKTDKPKQQNNIINNINRLIASSLLPDIFNAISSELKRLIGFDQMNIILLSEKNGGFELLEFTRDYESSRFKEGAYFRKEGSLWAEVVRTRKPIILKDTKKDNYWLGSTLFKEGIRSRLAFPLEYKDKVVGIINMESRRASNFSEEQFGLLEQIAPQLAIAVENAILFKRITTSEEKYKTLFDHAADPIILTNSDGRITTVNGREKTIIGYSADELLGKEISCLLPEEYRKAVSKLLADLSTDGRTQADSATFHDKLPTIELQVLSKNKQLIPMELDAISVKDGSKLLYTQIQLRDISERKKALEEARRYAEHLEKANKELTETQTQLIHSARLASVGQLAAGIAHQVNSPLGAVSGRIQMLINSLDGLDKASLREQLSKVANDCTRVTNIINDLLDFSRKARPTKTPVAVNLLLENALGMTIHSFMSKKIQVKKILDPNPLMVNGVADDLTHVFINIITNAIDAMEENGKLEIKSRFIKDTGKFLKPMVEISIKDNGHGISEKDQPRIFEPFYTTKEAGKGTGLGLAIAKRILDFHNAQINVVSKEGEGTTFFIYLPQG